MRIQQVSFQNFAGILPQQKDVDRAATVQDLNEMEDRIIAHNNNLYREQNRLIGDAFLALANQVYVASLDLPIEDIDNSYRISKTAAKPLT